MTENSVIFAKIGEVVKSNKGSILNFSVVGITLASEEFTKFIIFYCPCHFPRNKLYGNCFIWGPAFVLFMVGYLANRRTWRLTRGLCLGTQKLGPSDVFLTLCWIGMKAMIAPATWAILAFLEGDFYVCAHWPDPYNNQTKTREYYQLEANSGILPKPCSFNPNPSNVNPNSEAEIIAQNLRAESHIIGWLSLTIGMLIAVVVMFTFRCYSNFPYEKANFIGRYREYEVELFENKIIESSKKLAQSKVDEFFEKEFSEQNWDGIKPNENKIYELSLLHKLVKGDGNTSENTGTNQKPQQSSPPSAFLLKPAFCFYLDFKFKWGYEDFCVVLSYLKKT